MNRGLKTLHPTAMLSAEDSTSFEGVTKPADQGGLDSITNGIWAGWTIHLTTSAPHRNTEAAIITSLRSPWCTIIITMFSFFRFTWRGGSRKGNHRPENAWRIRREIPTGTCLLYVHVCTSWKEIKLHGEWDRTTPWMGWKTWTGLGYPEVSNSRCIPSLHAETESSVYDNSGSFRKRLWKRRLPLAGLSSGRTLYLRFERTDGKERMPLSLISRMRIRKGMNFRWKDAKELEVILD